MDKQTLFNNAYRHHVINNQPAGRNEDAGGCWYLSPTGARCAIGASIPEGKIFPGNKLSQNDTGATATLAGTLELCGFSVIDGDLLEFAGELQYCHDDVAHSENFNADVKVKYEEFAKENNLSIPTS